MEFADLLRFEDPVYVEKLVGLLRHKYSSRRIDVVIPVYDNALEFVRRYGESVFPGAAVVFCSVHEDTFKGMKLSSNTTGVTYNFDFDGTLDLARKLWPPTRHVAIVSGVDAAGRGTKAQARRALAKYSPELDFTYFSGTPIDNLQDEVRRLPRDTVIFILPYVLDSRDQYHDTRSRVQRITLRRMPPCLVSTRPCSGTVCSAVILLPLRNRGGWQAKWQSAYSMGKLRRTFRLRGAQMHEYMFDWRELHRWQIPESRLPPGSTVRYREPNIWDLYKYYILGGIALVIVQSLLIIVLLVNRRLRRRAEAELTENLRFEQVLSTLSSRFLAPPNDGIDQIVAQSLREIAGVLRFQRAALFEFSRGREELLATHQWAVEGTEPPPMRLGDR